MNVKRRIVDNKVAESRLDFENPSINETIGYIKRLRDEYERSGWTKLRIENHGEYDDVCFNLIGSRPETDAELRIRAGRAKAKATRTRKANR